MILSFPKVDVFKNIFFSNIIMSIDYRKIKDIDQFNELIESFVETRKALKQKIKEDKGETVATLQVGDKPLTKLEQQYAPIVKSIEKLGTDLQSRKTTSFDLFEKYANAPGKKTSEVMPKRERGKVVYKIGNNGVVNVEDVQDDIIRVVNPKTGESMARQLTPGLANLLFVPYKSIDAQEIKDDAWVKYYEILKFSGLNAKSNRNRKIQLAQDKWNRTNIPRTNIEAFSYFDKIPKNIKMKKELDDPLTETDDDEEPTPKKTPRKKPAKRAISKQFSTPKPAEQLTPENLLTPQFRTEREKRRQRRAKKKDQLGLGLMTIDDMVDRLHLMTQSQHAGNLSSQMQGEMMSIMDALLNKKVINRKQHKMLFQKYINF